MEEDDKTVQERIAEIRRTMAMVSELEAVRKKYGEKLKGSDTVNITLLIDDLEIDVYGSFANMVETRLRHLEQHHTVPSQETDLDERLENLERFVENMSPSDDERTRQIDASLKRIVEKLKEIRGIQKGRAQ